IAGNSSRVVNVAPVPERLCSAAVQVTTMKYSFAAALLTLASLALALDGQVGIHDPSTIALCNGKFYTYGTGGSSLVSDDGWTWRRGAPLPRRGLAPDVIHIGDR